MVAYQYNSANYQPSEGQGSVLPAGDYDVQIVKSEKKDTKARDGQAYLEMTLAITQGPHVGKKLKARFNLWNNSQEAVEIANSELCALSLVVGVPYWNDSQQLHGRPFKVRVSCDERNDRPGSYSNNVTAYMDSWGNSPNPSNAGQSQGFTQPAQPPQNPNMGMQMPPQNPGMGGYQPNPNPQGMGNPPNQGSGQMQPPPNQGQNWQGNGMQNPNNPQSGTYPPQNPQYQNPQGNPQYGTPNANSTGDHGMGNAPAPMGNAGYGTPPHYGNNSPQPGPMMGNPGGYQEQPPQGQYQNPQNAGVAGPGNSNPPPNYGSWTGAPPWA